MGTFSSGLSAMGCPPFFFELGATEGELREVRLRHARNITTAATTADRIDAYTILSYKDPGEIGSAREITQQSRCTAACLLTWSAILPVVIPRRAEGQMTSRRKWSAHTGTDRAGLQLRLPVHARHCTAFGGDSERAAGTCKQTPLIALTLSG